MNYESNNHNNIDKNAIIYESLDKNCDIYENGDYMCELKNDILNITNKKDKDCIQNIILEYIEEELFKGNYNFSNIDNGKEILLKLK